MAALSSRTRLAAGVGVTMLAVAAVFIGSKGSGTSGPSVTAATPPRPADTTSLLLVERTRGDSMAPITIWEFSDFQCPFCRDFARNVLPALEREYIATKKVRLIFVNLPLTRIHPNAVRAHEFAMCVARENRFWPFHDLLYRHQDDWARLPNPSAYFRGLVDSVGLRPQVIGGCADNHVLAWVVSGETDAARKAGISQTPSFVLEGMLMPGAFPIEDWRPILDSVYKAKRPF
ncbi:MAG: hypothetical protein EXR93_06225 [Gemmatimonadetes bacterium]|nr:hypothetical protein [Gemmatimonadota bacterium]